MAPAMIAALMRRGDALLAQGDISAARRFYERAAAGGSAGAALAAGRTYDPATLSTMGAQGIQPDRAAAREWYLRAIAMGEPAARQLLQALGEPGK